MESSKDKETWEVLANRNDGKQGWNEVAFIPQPTRYIKIVQKTSYMEGWGMAIFELEILGKMRSDLPDPEISMDQILGEIKLFNTGKSKYIFVLIHSSKTPKKIKC